MACFIPEFDQLLTQLGYDYNSSELPRSLAFKNALTSFVQQFISSDGIKGSELNDWQTHKADFEEMAKMFLDGQHQGELFWPDNNKHPFSNRLKYTTNYKQIHSIMAQLFYRYNTLQKIGLSRQIQSAHDFASQHAEQLHSSQDAEECTPPEAIKVRYNIYYEDESRLNYYDWHPEPGFLPQSLDELLCRIPGGEGAMGGRFILTGPGFQLNRAVFEDKDLVRVMCEFHHWATQCLTDCEDEDDMSMEEKTFTVDIHLQEFRPTSAWIFSCKQYP